MVKKDFYNSNLNFDLEKILSYDLPVKIIKNFDLDLDYPYILQVQDNDFFYPTKKERNKDYKKLISCFVLTYKVIHNKIPDLVTGADYFINKIRENRRK